jgi:hypothetical protein
MIPSPKFWFFLIDVNEAMFKIICGRSLESN